MLADARDQSKLWLGGGGAGGDALLLRILDQSFSALTPLTCWAR